ncbi:TetR/AcrR family transcriptional regulator [Cupriavidus basilensis]|uniref:TetR/AcrR family transcriptional regulator n=1 Tax=Cupriavidus basilensis TaxID=68895 RepID=UPI00157B4A82|nr:TetR/AcrR family transcriptional regulator [Cupriavidus basilensis]NUA31281.1 TetR/AcrR family transcriptional regulator [Cupriavidus basilensis]
MENTVRSERSRQIILDAAIAILAREGPGRLTIDAIAQEGGISKGRVMHQFRTKAAVVEALLDHQIEYFDKFAKDYLATDGAGNPEAQLSEQILAFRESVSHPQSLVFAILGSIAENPELLSAVRQKTAEKVVRIKEEAEDPDLALLRWQAAQGMVLAKMLGLCPLAPEERDRLFDRLLDSQAWSTQPREKPKPKPKPKPVPKAKPRQKK